MKWNKIIEMNGEKQWNVKLLEIDVEMRNRNGGDERNGSINWCTL